MKRIIKLHVNGEAFEVLTEIHKTLLEVLREDLGLTGTKRGCDLGTCGACTVLIEGKPYLSCLTLAVDVQKKKIVTIEGLAQEGKPHPLQKSFIEKGAIQCGFCTPGMILTAKAFLDEHPHPSEGEVKKAISGNLCRCTGYVKIVEAILSVTPSPSPLPSGERVWERGKGDFNGKTGCGWKERTHARCMGESNGPSTIY